MNIKLYRVANGENLTIDEESEKAYDSFSPHFIHLRNDEGGYILVVMQPEIQSDYSIMTEDDPEYEEIFKWASEDGFLEKTFDTEITGTVH